LRSRPPRSPHLRSRHPRSRHRNPATGEGRDMNEARSMKASFRALAWPAVMLVSALVVGCASQPKAKIAEPGEAAPGAQGGQGSEDGQGTKDGQEAQGVQEAKVLRDPGGFTITQSATVGFGVRGDYEEAVRLLEKERYEPAIALLLKVTEGAPALTAAHIDLGMA